MYIDRGPGKKIKVHYDEAQDAYIVSIKHRGVVYATAFETKVGAIEAALNSDLSWIDSLN
jgi:uncharacterized protein (UPF0248 family)